MDISTFNLTNLTSPYNVSLIIGIATLVVVVAKVCKSKTNQTETLNSCSNPECVRCTLYSEIVTKAKQRFRDYRDSAGESSAHGSKLQRIKESLSANHKHSISQKPEVFRLLNLKGHPWWSLFELSKHKTLDEDVLRLSSNTNVILQEFHKLSKNSKASWKVNDTPKGQWSIFHLINQGHLIEDNVQYCPETLKIVKNLSSLMSQNVFGNVAFSVINAGTDIMEHYGPTNIRIRCHLGLVTPQCCTMFVAGERRTWMEGECLVFDDSFLHRVQHNGDMEDGYRAILMVDLWHPGITLTERNAIDHVFAPQAIKN